jgi:hypothetical protein
MAEENRIASVHGTRRSEGGSASNVSVHQHEGMTVDGQCAVPRKKATQCLIVVVAVHAKYRRIFLECREDLRLREIAEMDDGVGSPETVEYFWRKLLDASGNVRIRENQESGGHGLPNSCATAIPLTMPWTSAEA